MIPSSESFTAQVDQVTEGEWNLLLDRFADANIYQTWAYGAICWGDRQLSHLVLRRGGVPVALAQLRIVRVPAFGPGIAYIRWGPVCVLRGSQWDQAVSHEMIAALVEEYVRRRRLTLRVIPSAFREDAFAPALSTLLSDAGMVADAAAAYRTLRVDLRASMDSIRARLAHKWRNQLNAAERNGMEIEEGTSLELFGEFTSLYREMMIRKQFDTTVSVADFQRIQERLPATQKMSIVIGRKDGRPLSGLVVTSLGTTGIYLLGATADDGMKAKGSYLLQWHVLRHLKERGCHCYDLGGINAESNPGVYHFKKGLGGDEVSQLGRYDLHSSRLNGIAISVAERMKLLAGRAGVTSKKAPAARR